ncbi:MAG: hypothetical protein V2A77_07445 [Pseudomonadota bacterium]
MRIRRGTVPYRLVLALASVVTFGTSSLLFAAAPPGEATSNITVMKAVPQPGVEDYVVGKNDHLWQLLRARTATGSSAEIGRLLALTRKLNPGLNLNMLVPGKVIKLPAMLNPASAAPAETAPPASTEAQKTPVAAPEPSPTETAGSESPTPAASSVATVPAGGQPVAEAPEPSHTHKSLERAAWRAGAALSALYCELGEESITRGQHFIPLPDTGQMVLDAAQFPLFQIAGSTRFVLDLDGEIPSEIDGLLADAGGMRIVRYDARRGVKGLLDDAFEDSGLDVRREASLTLTGPFEAEIGSDWMVSKGTEHEVICVVAKDGEITSTGVAKHLAKRGVHIIDVIIPEAGAVQVVRRETGSLPEYTPPATVGNVEEVVSKILTLLGQSYERNAMVSVFGGRIGEPTGFSLKFCADFGFDRGGKKYLVSSMELSPRWREFLQKRGYELLIIPSETHGKVAVASLLQFLGMSFDDGYNLMASSRGQNNNIRLHVPGLVVASARTKFIFSEAKTDEGLASALSQAGLQVIELQ